MKLILQAIKALFRKVENRIEDVRKSIPEVAQADWSQNDGTKPDYVKNRTHYAEKAFEDIFWDGDTDGRDVGYLNDKNCFCKVSDQILTVEDLVGSKIINESGKEIILKESDVVQATEDIIRIYSSAAVVVSTPTTYMGVVFPSSGVYSSLNTSFSTPSYTSAFIAKETVHTLDAKYLPDGIGGGGTYYLFHNGQSGDISIAPGTYAALKDAIENKKYVNFMTAQFENGNDAGGLIAYKAPDYVELGTDGIIHGVSGNQSYVFTINPDDTGTWFYDN